MITDEQRREDEAAYAAAFEDDGMGAVPADDDAGLELPGDGGEGGEPANSASDGESSGEPAAVVLAIADGDEVQEQQGQRAADATTTSVDEDLEQPVDPKEVQRQKSWEGRLRAREEELARREAELKAMMEGRGKSGEEVGEAESQASEGLERAAEALTEKGDSKGAEAVEQVAEAVESGELSAKQAMEILAEDFGPEFVKMIQAIASTQAENAARKAVEPMVGKVNESVQSVINSIVDDKTRSHFEAIADRHPDFNEVADKPEFAEFAKNYPGGSEIVERGSARQIIKMLDKFKESQQPAEQQPNPALDAAEGVRSTGMRLPEEPTKAAGYEDAWDQF